MAEGPSGFSTSRLEAGGGGGGPGPGHFSSSIFLLSGC